MRVLVRDIRLFFEVFGEESTLVEETMRRRPVLVGLHGGPGVDGTFSRYQLAPLADVAQVVVPDQRGHGRSDRGGPDTWNLATWAADVKGFCDALDIEHPIVLGSSFGGAVAQEYASTFPDHPAALILVSTGPRFPTTEEIVSGFREVGGDEAAEVARRDMEESSEETLAEWQRVCVPLLSRNPVADPLRSQLHAAQIQTPDVTLHFWQAEGKTLDLTPKLSRIRCPTLVLMGTEDPMAPSHYSQEMVAKFSPGLARLELIEDAAHLLFADNPERTYRCVRDFVAEVA